MVPKRMAISYGFRKKGKTTRQKVMKALAPSTFAASWTSLGTDCRPARMTSITNGAHSHATINVTLCSGSTENQGTARRPREVRIQFTSPEDGLRKRFFHIRAITDGVTKNGTVARARKTLRPQIRRFNRSARIVP